MVLKLDGSPKHNRKGHVLEGHVTGNIYIAVQLTEA